MFLQTSVCQLNLRCVFKKILILISILICICICICKEKTHFTAKIRYLLAVFSLSVSAGKKNRETRSIHTTRFCQQLKPEWAQFSNSSGQYLLLLDLYDLRNLYLYFFCILYFVFANS